MRILPRPLFLALALSVGMVLRAQSPAEMLAKYRAQWPDQAGLYLYMNSTIEFKITDAGVVGTRSVDQERIALKPPVSQSSREEVGYTSLVPLEKIEAWIMVPKDDDYKKVRVEDFVHRDERDGGIFHDDGRIASFTYNGMATGAITHLDYALAYPDARMISGHYFASGYPVLESVFTVICDKGVEVEARPFHIPEGAMQHTMTQERGKTVHRWTMNNVPGLNFEDDAPNFPYHLPHIQLLVRTAADKGKTDLQRLYAWDYAHIDSVQLDDDTTIQRIARETTAGLTDDRAKALALFRWMQEHITYVAVEDGMNGLVPAKPAAVCSARYGDCKGMANLLRSLMTNAGLKAHLTWIGTRNLPYSYDELPSTMSDDHMITAWEHEGKLILLDPTGKETPFGMPGSFIEGKQALVGIDADHYEVVDVPISPAEANALVDSVHAQLEGTTLKGSGTWTFTGYQRVGMTATLDRVERDKWKLAMSNIRMKSSNRFQVDSVQVDGLDDPNVPLKVHYWFTQPGFANVLGADNALPRLLDNTIEGRNYKATRKLPVEEEYHWTSREVVLIDVPEGFAPGHLPTDSKHEGPGFGYTLTCKTVPATAGKPAQLQLDNRVHVDLLMIEVTQIPAWRAMMEQLNRDANHTIVLEKQ